MSDAGKMPAGGCKSEFEIDWNLNGVESKECPVTFIDENINLVFKVFNDYSFKNNMPYSGGVLEQPCLLMNAVDLVEREWQETQKSKSNS